MSGVLDSVKSFFTSLVKPKEQPPPTLTPTEQADQNAAQTLQTAGRRRRRHRTSDELPHRTRRARRAKRRHTRRA